MRLWAALDGQEGVVASAILGTPGHNMSATDVPCSPRSATDVRSSKGCKKLLSSVFVCSMAMEQVGVINGTTFPDHHKRVGWRWKCHGNVMEVWWKCAI